MIRIEDRVDVGVSAQEAFAFVTRIGEYPTWLPGVLRAEPTGPPPTDAEAPSGGAGDAPEAGAGFRLVSAGPGGIEIVSTGRVESIDPPRSIAISAVSGFFALTASCEVTSLPDARARITVRAGIAPKGLAALAAGRIEQELRAAVPDTLRRLREAVEGAPAR